MNTATVETESESESEPDADEMMLDTLLDVVSDNPSILLEMLKATLAINSIMKLIGQASAVDDENPLIPGVQALLVAHEIVEIRKPLLEELSDPEWNGHAAGFTAETDIAVSRDAFIEASVELNEALGLDGDGEETAEAAQ